MKMRYLVLFIKYIPYGFCIVVYNQRLCLDTYIFLSSKTDLSTFKDSLLDANQAETFSKCSFLFICTPDHSLSIVIIPVSSAKGIITSSGMPGVQVLFLAQHPCLPTNNH